MTDKENLEVGIDAKVHGAEDAKKLATSISQINEAMQALVSSAKSVASAIDKVERTVAGVTKNTDSAAKSLGNETQQINTATTAWGNYAKAQESAVRAIPGGAPVTIKSVNNTSQNLVNPAKAVDPSIGNLSTKASREAQAAMDAAAAAAGRLAAAQRKNAEATAASQARFASLTQTLGGYHQQLAKQNALLAQVNTGQNALGTTFGNFNDGIFRSQFALSNLATGFAIAGAAILGFNGLVVKAATDYQTAMANIQRTSNLAGDGLQQVRDDFVELAQTIPVAFSELSQIGTLAGQLNIDGSKIANFTKTTAEFASSTDVSVQAAATAFGRLDTLLPDVQGRYENLGSAILKVGVNSVATESEIITTTNQIAAAGAQAGFTADQVIGLAASFASLGVAPEAARGSTIRVLSQINTAIATGSDSLEAFAKFAGLSAEQFKSAWAGDAGGTLLRVLQGLKQMGIEGDNVEIALRNLGITSVRDINALLRLSQNAEVVAQNFGFAADGFENGTELARQFGITSETLASKIQVLINSAQALAATIGESSTGPIALFVDILSGAAKALTDLVKNPVAQWGLAAVGALGAMAGGFFLIAAAITRAGSAAVSLQFVRKELSVLASEAAYATYSTNALDASLAKVKYSAASAALGVTSLKTALISTGIGAAVVVGFTAIAAATEAIGEATKSAGDKAKDAFGDLTELSQALQADTEAAKAGGEVFGEVEGQLKTTTEKTASWVSQVNSATGGQVALNDATKETTNTIEDETFKIGENTRAWLANKLANDENIQNLVKNNAALGSNGIDIGGVLAAAARGDVDAANKILDEYKKSITDVQRQASLGGPNSPQLRADAEKMLGIWRDTKAAIDVTSGALSEAAAKVQIAAAVNQALGTSTNDATIAITDMGDESLTTADAVSQLSDAISNVFSGITAVSDMSAAFQKLFDGIAQGGSEFSSFSDAGRTNIANLQQAIEGAIVGGQQLGISATESVGQLFAQLRAQGVNTDALIRQLSASPYKFTASFDWLGVQAFAAGTGQASAAGGALGSILSNIASQSGKASSGLNKVGGSAGSAAKQMYSLVEYASDLGSVFQRAFDIRFGPTKALDSITDAWYDMADAAQEANQKILELQVTLMKLTADQAVQQYFLSVANAFGDTLRAGEISAKLADINADLIKTNHDLADAQDATNKSLTGNSKAAIKNRGEILDLVSKYQEYIQSLAASGASQATLKTRNAQLKADFIAQATAAGYSASEIALYAKSFDDMALAIKKVPRNITVTANTNPAQQAINEFMAKNTKKSGGGAGGGIDIPVHIGQPNLSGIVKAIKAQIAVAKVKEAAARADHLFAAANEQAQAILKMQQYLAQIQSYSRGGLVHGAGSGTSDSNVARVSAGEYIIPADVVSRLGVPFFNALRSGGATSAAAAPTRSSGSSTIELGPATMRFMAMSQVPIYLDGREITTSVNNNNAIRGARGRG